MSGNKFYGDVGAGIAWLGFWLFLGSACSASYSGISTSTVARINLEIECIKAGREWSGRKSFLGLTPTCLTLEEK